MKQTTSEKTSIDYIIIKGAREHNLKNINLLIPKNKFVVFTGLSGSGKSSLAFDTLYAEGQRRYVESLSSYARQFLGVMNKPEIDHIEGLSPAISIDQKTTSHNPRSTVGTITEIYDYLRLLFARIGHPHCPNCGREVSTQSIDQIVSKVLSELNQRSSQQVIRLSVLSPIVRNRKGEFSGLFTNLIKQGYSRTRIDGKIYDINKDLSLIKTNKHNIDVLIDRITTSNKQLEDEKEFEALKSRITHSIEESLKLADGLCVVSWIEDQSFTFPENPEVFSDQLYSEKLACPNCNISIKELEPRLFSFNSPDGACETCNGLGSILKIDPNKILAKSLTLSEGAIVPFARVLGNDSWWSRLVQVVVEEAGYDFRKTPFMEMSTDFQDVLLHGSDKVYKIVGTNRFGKETVVHNTFEGFISNLERRYHETDSSFIRNEIEQYMQREICGTCNGARLKKEALGVTIDQQNINDITNLPVKKSLAWSKELVSKNNLNAIEKQVAMPVIKEIHSRLEFLSSVGLNYLTLHREASTLAGGEAQRIRLASQIGTGLTGVLYILDEPTIGLHPRDNNQLIETLKSLRNNGNSVVVVEHDRDVMLASDYIFDFGPLAGKDGGEVVAEGSPQQIMSDQKSLTGKYLSRKKDVKIDKRETNKEPKLVSIEETDDLINQRTSIEIYGASHHNLKNIDVSFPLRSLTCITGISGSGKSTLLHDTLYYNLANKLEKKIDRRPGHVERISIPDEISRVALIDQSPIGKTPRSNPATYTKIFDLIRKLFASTKESTLRGFNQGRFSFNVKGGRCETCQGEGQIKIEMQFLPDIYVECDVCHGKRYNQETLQVLYKDKNIAEVLEMTVSEALKFFSNNGTINQKLQTLIDVGLGYIKLGQPAPTLSGGEAQRVKLARELSTRTQQHVVYLLDEPTTGLHFADVQKLLEVLHQLVEQNNTVILIEHNLDIIKNCNWIIDLGPEGGEYGGEVIAQGSPQQIANNPDSFTGFYLKEELKQLK
ncbi:MAG: excinuclease ABC subunit UvrA [Patescibacteria group bacterium]